MSETNPYKAYADETILNASPLGLVIALYEGAIDSSVAARKCLATGDIPARTKAIIKLNNILGELMRSLNDEKGGQISSNLRRLYIYLQGKVIEAHTQKKAAALEEVERLLAIMLEGWRSANSQFDPSATIQGAFMDTPQVTSETRGDYCYSDAAAPYGSYLTDTSDWQGSSAYSF